MIKHMLALLLAFTIHVGAAQEVKTSSTFQNKSFSESQENTPLFARYTGCGGCGQNRPPSMAELLQAIQMVLKGGLLQLPEVQSLIAQQVLVSNLSNPLVVQTLAQIIAVNGIGGPPGPTGAIEVIA